METVEKIDSDVQSLNSELDRHDGKRSVHCDKRCKYLLGIVGLLLLMFLFGMLTRPAPKMVTVTEVAAVLDTQAPRVVQPELGVRLGVLHATSLTSSALLPTQTSTATEPRILTWTPGSVGKVNQDGMPVPLVGSYEVPGGWYGVIRVTASGEEIGSTVIDARSLTSASQGRFSITPTTIDGEKTIRLSLDAVKACRIACDAADQLCLAINVNYCTALFENQVFVTYAPSIAAPLSPIGQCITKTFVAGPKYAPQIPEDYTMCTQGKWNTNVVADAGKWMGQNLRDRISQEVGLSFTQKAIGQFLSQDFDEGGRIDNVSWSFLSVPGVVGKEMCSVALTVSVDCTDEETKKGPVSSQTTSIIDDAYKAVLSLTLPRVAHADGNCDGGYLADYGFGLALYPAPTTVVVDAIACSDYVSSFGIYQFSNFVAFPASVCGDGIVEGGESCDGGNLNGSTCWSRGFPGGGTLTCTAGCTFDTSACNAVPPPPPPPSSMCGVHCMGDAGVSACISNAMIIDPFPDSYGYCNICGGSITTCGGDGFPACGTPEVGWTWAMIITPDDTFACVAPPPPPVVNGACDPATNGVAVSSAPSSNLCSSGAAITVSGSGPWNWTCYGSGGGSDAVCSAPPSAACSNYWEIPDAAAGYTSLGSCSGMGIVVGGCCDAYGAGYNAQCTRTPSPLQPYFDTNYMTCGPSIAPVCGNGVIDFGEECDGGNLNGISCTTGGGGSYWGPIYDGGTLSCSASCTFNTSACTSSTPCSPNGTVVGTDMMCMGVAQIRFDSQCCSTNATKNACAVGPAHWVCSGPPPLGGNITVSARAVRCTSEADLPNWGANGTNPNITAVTAANWVSAHPSCSFDSGWRFEWWYNDNTLFGNHPAGLVGLAGTGNVSGVSPASGTVIQSINYPGGTASIWLRQVSRAGDVAFTNQPPAGNDANPVSAEFYCDQDVEHYDNLEYVGTPSVTNGSTYHCVAFNAPSAPYIANPGPVDFGAVPVLSSDTRNILLTNTGAATANVSLTLPSTPEGSWSVDIGSMGSFSIAPGATHTVTLTFTAGPVGGLSFAGTLLVNGANVVSVPVSGTVSAVVGTEIEILSVRDGAFVVDPWAIDVGDIGASAGNEQYDFVITKIGPLDMPYQVTIQGGAATGYSLSGTCSGTISTANPTDVCSVIFNPDISIVGSRPATILFNNQLPPISVTGADPMRVNFTANVQTGPITGVFPDTGVVDVSVSGPVANVYDVDFGSVDVASTKIRSIAITNTGDSSLNITSYTGLTPPAFTSSAGGPATVLTSGKHTISIAFTPTTAGAQTPGIITVQTNDTVNFPGGVVTIRVTGSGNAVPSLTLNLPNIGFPDWDIYSGGITRDFTITNNGSASSDVTLSVILTGSNGGEFSVSPLTRTIPADGTPYTFTVTFDPDTVGGRTADIRITPNNAPQQTLTVFGVGKIDAPVLLLIPNPIDFGRVVVPKTKTIAVNITNNDTRDFGFPTLQIVGADAGAFTCPECDDVGVPLNVGDSRTLNISFVPTAIGDYGDVVLEFVGGQNGITGYTIDMDATGVRPLIKYEEN